MSILQQGDSQSELCIADVRKEGVTVKGVKGEWGGTRGRGGFPAKIHRKGGSRQNASRMMKPKGSWLDERNFMNE